MDDQRIGAGSDHAARQRIKRNFRILIVDADPALDRTECSPRASWHRRLRRRAPAPPSGRRQSGHP